MAHLHLGKILGDLPGVKKDGAAFILPEDLDTVIFVALGQDVMQVAKVARVDPGELVAIVTHKSERFFFPAENVVGLRIGGESKPRSIGAGFR